MAIENVSDTARWVAVYRAMETERADAHFRDPWARRLAGEKGEEIVRTMRKGKQAAWAMIVRTAVFDDEILAAVRDHGVDTVVNLAAGLDTRPWRLPLPPALRWVDVDLPGILDYKAETLAGEAPRCRYEAVRADLTDPALRDEVLGRIGGEARRALVVSEGLLVYLDEADVAALAEALHAQPAFRWWLTDLASPALLKWMKKSWGKMVDGGNAPFRFAPAESAGWFEPRGWREVRWRGTVPEARRLRRTPASAWLWGLALRLSSARRRREMARFSGYVLLERI
ncbi:MAG: methyltransferase [Gemmatimonadetes bacterium]|nr:methyltransferase [Gemmatimonadota bacterium]